MSSKLASFLKHTQEQVNNTLREQIQQQGSDYASKASPALTRLQEATLYSTANGGKRVRPALFFASCEAFTESEHSLSQNDKNLIAASLECIHSYSLVHDDLPAMDDDALRRGQPTCHIAYDEATAILVGDGLQSLAFELISQTSLAPSIQIKLVQTLAKASGNFGMVGGQAIDMASEDQAISLEALEQLHALKTGALIRASVRMGALCCEASAETLEQADQFAKAIGLAFQVQDDILDIESDTDTLGKTQGADEALNKSTYPKLLGLEAAKQKAQSLIEQAFAHLNNLPQNTEMLEAIAHFIIERKH